MKEFEEELRDLWDDQIKKIHVQWDHLLEEMQTLYLKEVEAHKKTKSFYRNLEAFMNRMKDQIAGHQDEIRRLREQIKELKIKPS